MNDAVRTTYRPYYDAATFVSPAAIPVGADGPSNSFDYLDDASQAWLTDLGLSAARFYLKVAVAQPFEVSKFLVQASVPPSRSRATAADFDGGSDDELNQGKPENCGSGYRAGSGSALFDDGLSSSDSEAEPVYFAGPGASVPQPRRDRNRQGKRERNGSRALWRARKPPLDPSLEHSLVPIGMSGDSYGQLVEPVSSNVLDMISALVAKDGPSGLWRGLHTSYLYDAGAGVLASWFGGLLAGVLGVPSESVAAAIATSASGAASGSGGDLLQAVADPRVSLAVAAAALALAHAVLAPIALIRARFIVMPFYISPSRSLRSALASIRGWPPLGTCLLQITAKLARRLPEIAAPWLLYTRLGIDSFSAPAAFRLGKLGAQLSALLICLPLDTLAARAQVTALGLPPQALIIRAARYKGIVPSLWRVISGHEPVSSLYCGWRLEAIGLASNWGYHALESTRPSKEHF